MSDTSMMLQSLSPDNRPSPLTHQQWLDGLEERKKIDRLRSFLFIYNFCLLAFAGTVLGIGIWMAVDKAYLTFIIGTDMYSISIYMVLIGSGLVFLFAFIGCSGTITISTCLLRMFEFSLAAFGITLLVGAFIGIGFRGQIGDAIQESMKRNLIENYGVDFHKWINRKVTEAWDKAQENLQCCGVRTKGWDIYMETRWFEIYGAYIDDEDRKFGSDSSKPYVPRSCCIKDSYWSYADREVCQMWKIGPPGSPLGGAVNRALYYDGCYDQAITYLKKNSGVMIGLGIFLAIFLVIGIIASHCLTKQPNKYKNRFRVAYADTRL